MPLRLTQSSLASVRAHQRPKIQDANEVEEATHKMIDLALEEEKAKENRRKMDILSKQKEKFLAMHSKISRLQTQEERRNFIAELEKENKAILDTKAECKSHKDFVKRLDQFSSEDKFDYQLLIIAYNAIDKAEYKRSLGAIKSPRERAAFVQKLMEKLEAYEKLEPEEQSKRSFEMSRDEMREISFGQAAKQDFALNNRTVTFRFTVPEGYKHSRYPVQVPPSAGAPADGPREFVLLSVSKAGPHESQFVRSHHPVRFTVPNTWSKQQYQNGDIIGIRLGANLPVLRVEVPPGLKPGDVILKRLQVEKFPRPKDRRISRSE
mmetsp:Transcript_30826/g.57584  ORF Transcript_30826/g.57584 Transcript_30826/m.57584 type:complete len:322 (-) Transcript_30826:449-1414(-)|eukprot:CAMPEP_0170166742 /NCGR_PEP_ID=MMETSP0040_2-20121228/342_1 /TAXON_ID=641309 /ORGANISM="Lotharella oceanica, Strain CCMP622" /LENGTH=321 /DNA_ID=CAMNT_0010404547 /DNA_START=59 /DNA_END=1024 /DNA_ORIENTATION=+